MDRPQITAYFQHLAPAVRLLTADSAVAPEKRECVRQLLLDHDGAPALADLAALTGQDRSFSPLFQVVSALYALYADDVPGGDFGGLCRTVAARVGLGTSTANLFTRAFGQLLACPDAAHAALAIRPLANRAFEEGLKMPWRAVWRDLLRWDDSVRDRWRRSFQGAPARQEAMPAAAAVQPPGNPGIKVARSKGGRFAARAA